MKSHLTIFGLLLTGCASHTPTGENTVRVVPGTVLSPETTPFIRYAESMKAYPIGRYVDPVNPLILHEGHTLYRVETSANWNLNPHSQAYVPVLPDVEAIDPSRRPVPMTGELVAEIQKQKAATQAILDQGPRLNQTLTDLSQASTKTREMIEQNLQLKRELAETKLRLDALEKELRQPQVKGESKKDEW